MPSSRCVIQGCDNVSNLRVGISLHRSPTSNKPEYAKWLRFVRTHRANFNPKGVFVVCSQHFRAECFDGIHMDEMAGSRRRLLSLSVPTIWKKEPLKPFSARSRRKVISEIFDIESSSSSWEENDANSNMTMSLESQNHVQQNHDLMPSDDPFLSMDEEELATNLDDDNQGILTSTPIRPGTESFSIQSDDHVLSMDKEERGTYYDNQDILTSTPNRTSEEVWKETGPCSNCKCLTKQKKELQRKLRVTKKTVDTLNQKIVSNQTDWAKAFEELNQRPVMVETDTQTCNHVGDEHAEQPVPTFWGEMDDASIGGESDNDDMMDDGDDESWKPEQSDTAYEEIGDDDERQECQKPRLTCNGKNAREEPKGIVFLSKLLQLFQYCHLCLASNPKVSVTQTGTMLSVKSVCSSCDGTYIWKSQPYLLGKFPAGNVLLSFAILSAGASAGKVILVFKHMGLLCYSEATYYYHQRHLLFPSIVKFWRTYQDKILKSLNGKDVVLAGDGRHDSMGHSAKYGTYTIFCCTVGLIVHIVLVQANQAGSSTNMEFLGHQKAFAFLLGTGMVIKAFISDRHLAIAKWMREECPKKCKELQKPVIDHFFDLWHIGKKIQKVLTKLSKEKGCETIARWKKACVRHFYWSVTSTVPKLRDVIVAKFKAFLHHVLNIHHHLPNKIFNKCSHGPTITQRAWLTKGSTEYEKLVETLCKPALLNGIKNASPVAQTSCLEGYHSVVNQFAPKMLAYTYTGMFCRTILAAVHFNYNLRRKNKVDMNGNARLKVIYPKFKEGDATVREVRVAQNYDYVAEIYKTMMTTPRKELEDIKDELKKETPEALHSMLPDKENKQEAKNKYKSRKEKETLICPPTCTDAELQQILNPPTVGRKRKAPVCRKCGQPRKGHKKGQCSSTSTTHTSA